MKIKNMIIDGIFPLIFWGSVYFILVPLGFWTLEMYISWYIAMLFFSPMNILSGRIINRWRKITGYDYKGYT